MEAPKIKIGKKNDTISFVVEIPYLYNGIPSLEIYPLMLCACDSHISNLKIFIFIFKR